MIGADPSAVQRQLFPRLRAALVPLLTQGSWDEIEDDHRKLGLTWRPDLDPGWGKPKYVTRVLDDLPDDRVVAVARRAVERFSERDLFAVEDALFWIDGNGVAHISEVTRLALAKAFDGRRLHPSEPPCDVLSRFAQAKAIQRFEYSPNGDLFQVEMDLFAIFGTGATRPKATRSNHLVLLDSYGFREWPDARIFQLMEFLAHPTVRQGEEQRSLVQALNAILVADGFELFAGDHLSGHCVFKVRRATGAVPGRPKNLIFASTGPKPELGFADAVNNDIVILKHAEHCLIYDEPIGDDGLRWTALVDWWAAQNGLDAADTLTRNQLGERLTKSLASEPERRMFKAYFKALRPRLDDALPALVPQVYLHYDPMTLRELQARGDGRRLDVQRMDFLLLLPHGVRVILEIDGQQHYSTGMDASAKPSPKEYACTVRSDRHLRLAGYEVYRFGGHELSNGSDYISVVDEFFTRLFRRHGLLGTRKASPASQ